jgi:hypothetical protein
VNRPDNEALTMTPFFSAHSASTHTAVAALFCATLLAACGGGGSSEPGAAGAQASAVSDAIVQQGAFDGGLPTSYTLHTIPVPQGNLSIVQSATAKVINADGKVVGVNTAFGPIVFDPRNDSETVLTFAKPDEAVHTYPPYAINDASEVAGIAADASQTRRATFHWSASTGGVAIPGTAGPNTGAPQVFLSSGGIVGGGISNGDVPCSGFRWDSATGALQSYPSFCPSAMNDAGSMFGAQNGESVILSPDGSTRPLVPGTPLSARDGLIADDDTVFTSVRDAEIAGLKFGAVAVSNGHATNIGLGLVTIPPDVTNVFESSTVVAISGDGQAIGTDDAGWTIDLSCGSWGGASVPFHWSAADGATAITVPGEQISTVRDINRNGLVVGRVASGKAFAWTRATGGVLLEPLVSNLPPNTRLLDTQAIGDGGHILAILLRVDDQTSESVVLVPDR